METNKTAAERREEHRKLLEGRMDRFVARTNTRREHPRPAMTGRTQPRREHPWPRKKAEGNAEENK